VSETAAAALAAPTASTAPTAPATGTDAELFDQLNREANVILAELMPERILDAPKSGKPFVLGTDDVLPEIVTAMDLYYNILTVTGALATALPDAAKTIDSAIEMGVESRLCTAVRCAMYYLYSPLMPKPDAIVTTNSPCDAVDTLGIMMDNHKPWASVPKFRLDAPHGREEEDFVYFGKQMKEMVLFLERTTGRTLDLDRFRALCEESNKQGRLLAEFQELKRAIPCPVDPDWARRGFRLSRWIPPGRPEVTVLLERLVAATEKRVKAKQGIDGVNEKIRFLWWDVSPTWAGKLFPRLAKELGAVCLMDYYSYAAPWTVIDTTSEESALRTFGKRYLVDTPMTRQAMHGADFWVDDILRIVKDFSIHAVVMPCHIGHKDLNAIPKIARDACRDAGIPFLFLGCDVWDERYMPPDKVFDTMKTFFDNVGLS